MRYNKVVGNVNIKIDTSRINKNLRNAQAALNEAIGVDCTPLVPVGGTGHLRDSFRYGNGDIHSGFVEWDIDYAHFQYVGYVRTDERGRVWVRHQEHKPILTTKPLHYQQSGGTSKWFEKAKQKNLQKWVNIVKDEIGKE